MPRETQQPGQLPKSWRAGPGRMSRVAVTKAVFRRTNVPPCSSQAWRSPISSISLALVCRRRRSASRA